MVTAGYEKNGQIRAQAKCSIWHNRKFKQPQWQHSLKSFIRKKEDQF